MTISLTTEQQAWLEAHIADGDFASLDEAVRRLIDARIIDESDDLAWARGHVAEALAAADRGEVITREAHRARNTARLASIKG